MKPTRRLPLGWKRPVLALTGGLMLGTAFPKIGWFWLAWVGPGLILLSVIGLRPAAAFRIGCIAGAGQFLVPFHWLLLIPFSFHAVAAWLGVGGLLSCYTALWTCASAWLFPQKAGPAEASDGWPDLRAFDLLPSWEKVLWTLGCALFWVAMEMGIVRLFNGLPYALGVSQFQVLPLIQIAAVTGVYGVSFILVWCSIALTWLGWRVVRNRRLPAGWFRELIWPMAALAAMLTFGAWRLSQREPSGQELRIALVQPAIPQRRIWEPSEKTNRLQTLLQLSAKALESKPDLLVWPEAALPNFFTRFNPALHDGIVQLGAIHPAWMILGATDAQPRPGLTQASSAADLEVFNSSFLIHPSGELVAKYHKRRLVVFGEYMPLARWFPFLNRFRSLDGGYQAGRERVPFLLTNLNVKIAVLICGEDTYPHLVRGDVDEETDFLLNLTNNGWFGESAAQWQHAIDGLFRAVENGLPLVRCGNNGLTCWIDSRGRMHSVYFPGSKNVYQAGFKVIQVPLIQTGQKRLLTLYGRYGDWFGWSCITLSAGLCLRRMVALI